MIVPPGLDLLARLIRDHRADRGGGPALIPCLHEELDEDIPLLLAGAQREGGHLYFLSRPEEEWEWPNGPVHTDRRDVVEGMLADAGEALPGQVIIELDVSGRVVVRLKGHSAPLEPSLVPILRAAAVAASAAYDEFDFVILTTGIATTDARRRMLLWNLLTISPLSLGLKDRPKTIVPMVGSTLDPTYDYRRLPYLRYVVRWDRVIQRSQVGRAQEIKAIAGIGPSSGPVVLFLGAGASSSAGIRLGNHYRDIALAELVGDHLEGREAAEAFYDLLRDRGHFLTGEGENRDVLVTGLTLERVLLETFNSQGFRPRADSKVIQNLIADCANALQFIRPGRRALRGLAEALRGELIIMTVNFDQLVEDGLPVDHSVFFRHEDYEDTARIDDLLAYAAGDATKPLPVLKLHGSIEDPESLIATIDTTSAGLHGDVISALNKLLDATDKPLRWVWVGCSMRDRDMNRWLTGLGSGRLDEWWVDPMPGESLNHYYTEVREAQWRGVGLKLEDRVIVDSADGFLQDLMKQIEQR
ncbi:SIR2 family protein [Ornithinimicrobium avium]|uniref:Uncharacterized protein n=1 Tax=Ornithinimicrobium avium TaxID=2283195 RepID=A0A345NNM0_9MICO|nr:SIR2 family protein [Ornithinimicrobium avium]AXH96628.1 hypothetical protein DV701_11285 [Ornithinimicrobium avium]